MSDARHILQNHYKDASRLDARIHLHAKYSTNTQGIHAWVFEHLRLPPTCHVLEVGCGSGQLWLVNHHRLPAGWHVTLSDLSAGMLMTAHRQLSPRRWRRSVGAVTARPYAWNLMGCAWGGQTTSESPGDGPGPHGLGQGSG